MPPENVVVAFSTNMPPELVAVFCRSVRESLDPRTTEIVIITNDPEQLAPAVGGLDVHFHLTSCDHRPDTTKLEKLFKRTLLHGCRLFSATPLDRRLSGGAAGRIKARLAESWCHPLTARWFSYENVLRERPWSRRVLLTDVKDVIVQADCFAGLDEGRVRLFEQSEPYGQCRWDSQWLRDGWGRQALASMKGTLPVNAGTILGGYRPMRSFLRRVTRLLDRYPFRSVDQAAINYMLHREGDGHELARVPNIRHEAVTLAGEGIRATVETRSGQIVRNEDGTVIPIVHMWDRYPDLNQLVLERFGPSTPADEMFEAPPESIFDSRADERTPVAAAGLSS